MILTHEAILEAREAGRLVVEPFRPDLVSINSVDVRLGADLWKLDRHSCRDLYRTTNNWKKVAPFKASEIRDCIGYKHWAQDVIPDDAPVFYLESGQFYLATTLEAIGTTPGSELVPEMKAKSTVGRQGLTVALCAGLGDVGYSSRWALEVRVTDDGDVPLAIGTPVAQVVFHEATQTKQHYNGKDRYQHHDEARFLPKPLKFIDD
jgi:dCTP deaminase